MKNPTKKKKFTKLYTLRVEFLQKFKNPTKNVQLCKIIHSESGVYY